VSNEPVRHAWRRARRAGRRILDRLKGHSMTDLVPRLQALLQNPEELRKLQRQGLNVLPVTFYSNSPSLDDIDGSFEYASTEPPYLDPGVFRADLIRAMLETLIPHSEDFTPPLDGDQSSPAGYFWNNAMYSYCDAMSYWAFIRHLKPRSVVEVGSGFSTLVALEARERNGAGEVHCIEPYPPRWLEGDRRITLHAVRAQEIQAEFLNDLLRDGDILFIDSTHTVKTGSDCLHLYLRVLPRIRRNIHVHVHDVFLPFAMPKDWLVKHHFYWTEQYLLMAFLLDNSKATVVYGSAYNAHVNREAMERLMRGRFPVHGGSLWFRYDGASGGRGA
jgi:hypothetical protein